MIAAGASARNAGAVISAAALRSKKTRVSNASYLTVSAKSLGGLHDIALSFYVAGGTAINNLDN
jgi:hypothetical protein